MRYKMWLLCRKELLDWFYSIKTYLGLTVYLALSGYMISNYVSTHGSTNIEGALPNLIMLFIVFIPLMAVISINKETKYGGSKIVISSPTTVLEIVMAKFISIYIISLLALVINCVQFAMVRFIDVISFRLLASTFFGYAILLFAITALSIMLASFTGNAYVNYMISFVTMVIILLLSYFYKYVPSYLSAIYAYVSLFTDIKSFWLIGKGSLYPIVHSFAITCFAIYTAALVLEKRWQDE